jgi:peptidoglycan/LPS O-acetylase OafA/YrhL
LQVGYVPELAHLWSLAVEEQFYLLWPLALVALLRERSPAKRLRLCRILLAVALLLRLLTVAAAPFLDLFFYALPTTWVDSILIGALCALIRRDRPDLYAGISSVAAKRTVIASAALIIGGFSIVPGTFTWWGTYLIGIPALCAATAVLVLNIADGRPSAFLGFLASHPARAMGSISYGLYLYNSTCIMLIQRALGAGLTQRLLGVVMALLLAWLSYRWVELPALRLKEGLAPGRARGTFGKRLAVRPDKLPPSLPGRLRSSGGDDTCVDLAPPTASQDGGR